VVSAGRLWRSHVASRQLQHPLLGMRGRRSPSRRPLCSTLAAVIAPAPPEASAALRVRAARRPSVNSRTPPSGSRRRTSGGCSSPRAIARRRSARQPGPRACG
jgi:hypothetical protein